MSIVLGAFLPHAPLLLPTADPAHHKKMLEAARASAHVAGLVYAAQVDTILLFNPHADSVGNSFTFNQAANVTGRFEELGDLSTTVQAPGAPMLAHRLKEKLEPHFPVSTSIPAQVNYGMGVPMLAFQKLPHQPRWLEISARRSTVADHETFGVAMQAELINSHHRIAIIATGDITAGVTEASPQGKIQGAQALRLGWSAAVKRNALGDYLRGLAGEQVASMAACGVWSAAQLQGTLNSLRTRVAVHYDAAPYGVAYQVITWLPE
ncbi:MAG: hypothetical protein AAB445_00565 [Patescibacteria group bacterium]